MLGLTSLVDVVFILLFFFMLAAREAAPQALSLTVSDAAKTSAAASTSQSLLRVLGGGRIELDGRVLELSALESALRAGARDQVKVAVTPAAQLQDLIDALEPMRAAGIDVHLLAPAA